MKKLIIMSIVCFLVSAVIGQSGGYKIIVNKDNVQSQLTSKQVKNIFLKKTAQWDNGSKIQPVDQKSSAKIRESFTSGIFNKSISAIKAYWQKQIFTGKGTPPVEKASDQAVLEYVKSHPGAIGYVSASTGTGEVKIIKIVK